MKTREELNTQRSTLLASIQRWEEKLDKLRRDEEIDLGPAGCPCCEVYYRAGPSIYEVHPECCSGCPIAEAVGDTYCDGTPYVDVIAAYPNDMFDEAEAAAVEEIAFLKEVYKQLETQPLPWEAQS